MNFLEHVFPRSSDPEPERAVYLSMSSSPLDFCCHDQFVLDLDLPEEITHEHALLHFQDVASENPWTHLGMTMDQWNFIVKDSVVSGSNIPSGKQPRSFASSSSETHVEPSRERSEVQGHGERSRERSGFRDDGGSAESQRKIQEESSSRAGHCSDHATEFIILGNQETGTVVGPSARSAASGWLTSRGSQHQLRQLQPTTRAT